MLAIALVTFALSAEPLHADLLIVGGDEAGCAAAVQAARLGVKNIVLVSDCDWLGGQFSTQGVGPMDEWTVVAGKRVNFPRSGTFLEIVQRIRAHNRATYGTPTPGNSWCGTETIEPRAAARIFHDWIEDHPQIRVLRGWHPVSVATVERRVTGVTFAGADPQSPAALTVLAKLTVDSSDWGDVIRLSGADYMAGPDLKSRFGEPSAPETLEPGGRQEMNPLSWCPLLRETGRESVIAKPPRYDARSFAEWQSAPTWVDWDGSGGIYNSAGWCIYTHRRIIDRRHFGFAPNTEAVILNWPAQDYPLGTLPAHVVAALEKTERGASLKNIVDMTPAERRIVYDDARQRALEFVHWLQTDAHNRAGDHPASFRYMQLADDYGTADQLPPKPYIREGLRLEALYVLREQDVRTNSHEPRWAKVMVPDGI
ncbi:MAG TPA: FAD-dependent oxidoreductase, partial [Pirellulales bacterium]